MFTAELFQVAKVCQQPQSLSADTWVSTTKHHPAIKMNEMQTPASMWTDLLNIALSEESQLQKGLHLYESSRKKQSYRAQEGMESER